MNPFATPDRTVISRRPQDMRAVIQRLAATVVADFGGDPQDGALYRFVSRDCAKAKMLRFDTNGWCLYYVRLAEGAFRWEHRPDYADPGSARRATDTGTIAWQRARTTSRSRGRTSSSG